MLGPKSVLLLFALGIVLGLSFYWELRESSETGSGSQPATASRPEAGTAPDTAGRTSPLLSDVATPNSSVSSPEATESPWDRLFDNLNWRRTEGEVLETDDQTLQLVEQALTASEAEARAEALAEIGLLDSSELLKRVCLKALFDPEPEVREEAILALEMLEATEALPFLEALERDDVSEDVREAARDAIEALAGPPGSLR